MWDPLNPQARKIRYYILHAPKLNGQYTESAWVQFETDVVCAAENKIVAFPPWSDGVSIFISHPQGRRTVLRDVGLFVKGRSGGTWDSNELRDMAVEIYEHWARLTEESNEKLKGLPKFRVKFMARTPPQQTREEEAVAAAEAKAGLEAGQPKMNAPPPVIDADKASLNFRNAVTSKLPGREEQI